MRVKYSARETTNKLPKKSLANKVPIKKAPVKEAAGKKPAAKKAAPAKKAPVVEEEKDKKPAAKKAPAKKAPVVEGEDAKPAAKKPAAKGAAAKPLAKQQRGGALLRFENPYENPGELTWENIDDETFDKYMSFPKKWAAAANLMLQKKPVTWASKQEIAAAKKAGSTVDGFSEAEQFRQARCPLCGTTVGDEYAYKDWCPVEDNVWDCSCGDSRGFCIGRPEAEDDMCGGSDIFEEEEEIVTFLEESIEAFFGDKGTEVCAWNCVGFRGDRHNSILKSVVKMDEVKDAKRRIEAFVIAVEREEDTLQDPDQSNAFLLPFDVMPVVVDARNRTDVWVWCARNQDVML